MTPKTEPESGSGQATLQIGEVAERTGVTQRTLRFYEEKGLLRPPERMDGGFRLYSEADVKRVEQPLDILAEGPDVSNRFMSK